MIMSMNRRTLFGALALAATGAAVPAAAGPQLTEAQKKLAVWAYSFKGEEALEVVQHVIEAGYGYDDIEGIAVTGIRPGETRRVVIYVDDGRGGWSFDKGGRRNRTRAF